MLLSELAIIFCEEIWIRHLWNQAGPNNVTFHRLKKLSGYIATGGIRGSHTLTRSTSSSLTSSPVTTHWIQPDLVRM